MFKQIMLAAALTMGAAQAFDQSHVRITFNDGAGPSRVSSISASTNNSEGEQRCLIKYNRDRANIALVGHCTELTWNDVRNYYNVNHVSGVSLDQRISNPVEYLNRDGGYETNEDFSRREYRLTAELADPATSQARRQKIEQVMRWEGNKRLQATARFYRLYHECIDESTPYERKLEIRQNLNNTNEYVAELHEAHTGILQFCR